MEPIFDEIKRQRIKTYYTIPVDLSVARNNEQFNNVGNYVYVLSLSGTADIIFNELSNDPIPLNSQRSISTPFYRFFIKNAAQVGGNLILGIGIETGNFKLEDYSSFLISDANIGEQVIKYSRTLATTTILYTVNAGKKLLMEYFLLSLEQSVAATPAAQFFVTDSADTLLYTLAEISNANGGNQAPIFVTGMNLIIQAGNKVKLLVSGSCVAFGSFKGREITA